MGSIETLSSAVKLSGHTASSNMSQVPLTILPTARDALVALTMALFTSESRTVVLRGTVDATINFGFFLGQRVLPGIGVETNKVLTGLNGLPDIKFVSLIENTVDAVNEKQTISLKVNIKSISNINVKMGDIVFETRSSVGRIGTTTFKTLSLDTGDNSITAVTVVDLSLVGSTDFVSGLDTADRTLTLTGFAGSTQNPAILPAIQALHLTVVIPKKFTSLVA